jgi:hypothetical protein
MRVADAMPLLHLHDPNAAAKQYERRHSFSAIKRCLSLWSSSWRLFKPASGGSIATSEVKINAAMSAVL